MVRIDAVEMSIQGTWIDGYLPERGEIERLLSLYCIVDLDYGGLTQKYNLNHVTEKWSREDIFISLASALQEDLTRRKGKPDVIELSSPTREASSSDFVFFQEAVLHRNDNHHHEKRNSR